MNGKLFASTLFYKRSELDRGKVCEISKLRETLVRSLIPLSWGNVRGSTAGKLVGTARAILVRRHGKKLKNRDDPQPSSPASWFRDCEPVLEARRRFNDYNGIGLRCLVNIVARDCRELDSLRYSLAPSRDVKV